MRDSRVAADVRDASKCLQWLRERSPWAESECLRSLSSGIVADSSITSHNALSVGSKALVQITGSNFADIKLTRKNKVLSLATMGASVKRDDVVAVDSQQLFMRIIWAMSSQERDLSDYLKYELASRPPALFDDVSMRKTSKAVLLDLFDYSEPPDTASEGCAKVIDGGYLLRSLVWPRPATFREIIDAYYEYVVRHFTKNVTVVFDGYSSSTLSTKSEEHKRRCAKRTSPNIKFDSQTTVSVAQADFLANAQNKSRFIGLLSQKFESNGILVRQATADADSLIVETSLQESKGSKKVMVIATDTDVLLMMIAPAPRFNNLSFVSPGSRLYDIESVQKPLKSKRNCLLFLHAITGCDTTSALYKKGKKKAWKLLDNPDVQNLANEFNRRDARKESVISAGEKFITKLYAGREEVKNTKV